jgi:DNA-binding transcriptional LysR family regulator
MPFRSYDTLRVFTTVARHESVTAAASELNLSKASVSYQIRKLEDELRFPVFERKGQRLHITPKGEKLMHSALLAFGQLDRDIRQLKETTPDMITIGALTYFFSRWLSSRLMSFMEANPSIAVRVEPITGIADLPHSDIDVAICWGAGDDDNADWHKSNHELDRTLLFNCPARPTANALITKQVQKIGLERALREIPLLADSSGSSGWQQWHQLAGLEYRPMQNRLVIPDSNDRVQAVIDGQGIALWDDLIQNELDSGELFFLSELTIEDAGYYLSCSSPAWERSAATETFIGWIQHQN